jgi:hypothetical protein
LLAQVLQHVQLLIEVLRSAARSGFADFFQPLTAMTGVVDISSRTRNRPAAVLCRIRGYAEFLHGVGWLSLFAVQ